LDSFHTPKQIVRVYYVVPDPDPTESADPNREIDPGKQNEGKIKKCNTLSLCSACGVFRSFEDRLSEV
jgi:hypothetical protein